MTLKRFELETFEKGNFTKNYENHCPKKTAGSTYWFSVSNDGPSYGLLRDSPDDPQISNFSLVSGEGNVPYK